MSKKSYITEKESTQSCNRMKSVMLVVLFACMTPAFSQAALIDFNGLGPVGDPPPTVVAGGVSVSFSNWEISEIGAAGNGFSGVLGGNQVADEENFNGRFLTALGFNRAQFRTPGFVRTIEFDMAVKDVSMYIADIDSGEGITLNAFDESDTLLSTLAYPAAINLDSAVLLVDFGTVTGIRKVTLVGNDPIGIDNLSFEPVAPLVPALTCNGFMPPFDQPLSLKKKVKRAIPVDMVLTGADGYAITDTDILAPPVINVLFDGQVFGEDPPDTDDLLPLGSANEDNIFRFDIDSWQWIYNLGTKQFTAAGKYTVTVASGDETEYTIDTSGGQCTQYFERLE
jgi:hypothetical protein